MRTLHNAVLPHASHIRFVFEILVIPYYKTTIAHRRFFMRLIKLRPHALHDIVREHVRMMQTRRMSEASVRLLDMKSRILEHALEDLLS